MIASNKERDDYLDRQLDNQHTRSNRHRKDLNRWIEECDTQRGILDKHEEDTDRLREDLADALARIEEMSTKLCRCREGKEVVTGEGTADIPFELEYAEPEEEDTTGTSSPDNSYHEAPLATTDVVMSHPMGPSPILPIIVHRDESARSHVPACCQALPTPQASPLVSVDEEVEEVTPEGVQGLEGLISWQEARRRFLGLEREVRTRKTKSGRKVTEGRRSTGIHLTNKRFHPYHISSESNLRRGFRRAERDLSGYESSSESGSDGLSCDTERGDGRHSSSGRRNVVPANLGTSGEPVRQHARSSSRVDWTGRLHH